MGELVIGDWRFGDYAVLPCPDITNRSITGIADSSR